MRSGLILLGTLAFTCLFNFVIHHPMLEFSAKGTALRSLGKLWVLCEKAPHSLSLHSPNTDQGVQTHGKGDRLAQREWKTAMQAIPPSAHLTTSHLISEILVINRTLNGLPRFYLCLRNAFSARRPE